MILVAPSTLDRAWRRGVLAGWMSSPEPASPCCTARTTAASSTRPRISVPRSWKDPQLCRKGRTGLTSSYAERTTSSGSKSGTGAGWATSHVAGLLTAGPAVSSWAPNQLDVFARGSDNALYHKSWNGIAWGEYQRLGGNLEGAPAAVSRGPHMIDVFFRGRDNHLYP
jgi:Repeat of unknown function (DUF346)